MNAVPLEQRENALKLIRERFRYPITILPIEDLTREAQEELQADSDVVFVSWDKPRIAVALEGRQEAVILGPFPNYRLTEIEESIGGWVLLTAEKLSVSPDRRKTLKELSLQFDFPIVIDSAPQMPDWAAARIKRGDELVFYPEASDRWFAATRLPESETELVRFGPFPNFENIDQKATTTTVALVLILAATAIALLLRPVARQLRKVENAAARIAGGDLSARVEERKMYSAKPLAQAFNHMANRTESLVRTQRELLQAVSHELRTPLARMRFAIDLIATAKDERERSERLESLDAATEELDELVSELLSYVRMETAEPKLNQESICVSETLQSLLQKFSSLHPSIKFSVNDNSGQDTIVADRHAFQRAIGNLLANACRFAQRKISIVVESDPNTNCTAINVDDDGPGIDAADRERVFEPFVRLESDGTSGEKTGVGLGLALVKRIVMQHGGSVTIHEAATGGCRFRTTWG